MSLYNLVHGVNPMSGILLAALGNPDVPRFRDCYLDGENIAIHTRTGGGNRETYELGGSYQEEYNPDGPFNDDLRALPGFIRDEDDEFDATYATFYFAIPEAWAEIVSKVRAVAPDRAKPADAWQKLFDDLNSGTVTPAIERAVEVIGPILQRTTETP